MRWQRGYRSSDVEVRKGGGGIQGAGMGGGLFSLLLSLITSRFGWIGALLAIGAFYLFMRGGGMSSVSDQPASPEAQQYSEEAKNDPRVQFVSFVLDDVQNAWDKIFTNNGRSYEHAKMVIFDGATPTACGAGQTATGPFYCPLDHNVYLDLGFFRLLEQRLGAKGDFAQAYVIAHEVGHHVQAQEGTIGRGKESSVPVELQADCYAGVWASSTRQRDLLEAGDIEEAMGAASAVGDDRLQKMSQGTVQPEKWTHGSSRERAGWFKRGLESGDPRACDTFHEATASNPQD